MKERKEYLVNKQERKKERLNNIRKQRKNRDLLTPVKYH